MVWSPWSAACAVAQQLVRVDADGERDSESGGLRAAEAAESQLRLAGALFDVGDGCWKVVRVQDGRGDVEGDPADAGALGFFTRGLDGAGAVVAFALGLVSPGAVGPGAADLPGGHLGFDLRGGLVGGVRLVEPGRAPRERSGRQE